ncbi:MAG: tRNA lysidine(34) synthetase TilS [Muribaculaceae bacterium]|nr:tRNA lysidine(34) synthetase TilS [Muribaculaceae bacterium]
MSLLEKVTVFSRENRLFPHSAPVGVGLSGGADSVALLRVLLSMGVTVKAYHCNFHLRGLESDRDEAFCRSLCDGLGVDLTVRHFDVQARMKESGESVEMACRSLRYQWWDSLPLSRFAVAHHADDNVETLFLNMMRGSGLRGMRGMQPVNGKIVRPLLCVTRSEILRFLARLNQHYVTDSTNASDDFRRNRLRNTIIPHLEQLFPGAIAGIMRTQSILSANSRIFDRFINDARPEFLNPQTGIVRIDEIESRYGDDAPEILYELVAPGGLTIKQCADIFNSTATHSGRLFRCKDGRVYAVGRGTLVPYLDDSPPMGITRLNEYPFSMEEIGPEKFRSMLPPPRNVMFLDADMLTPHPTFLLRPWAKGDRMAPFGLNATKLVSDIYNDNKIGVAERRRYPILEMEGKILWVCGLRPSRHYAVTPQTRRILKIEYHQP